MEKVKRMAKLAESYTQKLTPKTPWKQMVMDGHTKLLEFICLINLSSFRMNVHTRRWDAVHTLRVIGFYCWLPKPKDKCNFAVLTGFLEKVILLALF